MKLNNIEITQAQIEVALEILKDNGIEPDECETVLQSIGYALLDTELFPEETFITDLDKMADLLNAIMAEDNMTAYDEFLEMYSDVSQNQLDDTVKEINADTLAELMRQAENANIEEINGRPTGLKYTAEQYKSVISDYVFHSNLMKPVEQNQFVSYCNNMAC